MFCRMEKTATRLERGRGHGGGRRTQPVVSGMVVLDVEEGVLAVVGVGVAVAVLHVVGHLQFAMETRQGDEKEGSICRWES